MPILQKRRPPPPHVLDMQIKRENRSYVSKYEQPLLSWFMTLLPLWYTPDLLTATGILGAVLTGYGYATEHLLLASCGLVVHWFGDSLDGFCARYRNMSRPRYGLFVDFTADAVSVCCMIGGMGLSPYVDLSLALCTIVLALSVFHMVLFTMMIEGVNRIDVDGIGGTEGRLVFIGLNGVLSYLSEPWRTFWVTHVMQLACVAIAFLVIQRFLAIAGALRRADTERLTNTNTDTQHLTSAPHEHDKSQ